MFGDAFDDPDSYSARRPSVEYQRGLLASDYFIALAPILIPIEVISYVMRPVSLSIRLFANMMAGHTMLKVFAGFTVMMISGLGALGFVTGLIPLAINVALTGFEFLVAFLQAYVFSILTCLYIRDALELH